MMKRAALYARVATDDGASGRALERQVRRLCEYAELHDFYILNIYKDVASGLKEDRSGLQLLMRDAATSMFDVVLLLDPTRLFRDMALFQEYYRRLCLECGVDVIFVRGPMGENGGDA